MERAVREVDPRRGLTEAEAERRLAQGLGNETRSRASRSVADIVRANVMTRFNAILGALLVVILVVGPLQDALFGIVLVTNALVGIVQELRAKRALDHLALLTTPRARARRDGAEVDLLPDAVVLGDVLLLSAGDQVVADGTLLEATHLEVDESLLTGESEPVDKAAGDRVLSGSFAVAGSGAFVATAVGEDSYAHRLADEAKHFQLVRSELRVGIDRILQLVTWAIVPVGTLLVVSRLFSRESAADAVRGSVAGIGSMVPEGLVLLTSIAFALSVLRLAERHVVVQDLAAVEMLARVDVVCIDKTGTLTEPELTVTDIVPAGGMERAEVRRLLATFASAEPRPNATLRAVAAAARDLAPLPVRRAAPFSSARKWSAVETEAAGTWVLGGADVVLDARSGLAGRAAAIAARGARVLAVVHSPVPLADETLPRARDAVALLALEERIRPDAAATIAYFAGQGVTVKVLSGDHPATVEAVARRVGVPLGGPALDARRLPGEADELRAVVERVNVIGRVTPDQKRTIIAALQANGHVVAMTGDGVNDVPALKQADLGVAMASGSAATRTVAPVVLGDSSFSALPAVVAEGRRVIGNIEQVANLFVTKTVYASLLALAVGVGRVPFPFLPRHLTIISSLTIGLPAFFLALAPNRAASRPGFVRRVAAFAVPAGVIAAGVTFAAFAIAHVSVALPAARTVATASLFVIGLRVLSVLARPLTTLRRLLLVAMALTFVALLLVPPARSFFALEPPPLAVALEAAGVVALGLALVEMMAFDRIRRS